jgi:hypothetical protein
MGAATAAKVVQTSGRFDKPHASYVIYGAMVTKKQA